MKENAKFSPGRFSLFVPTESTTEEVRAYLKERSGLSVRLDFRLEVDSEHEGDKKSSARLKIISIDTEVEVIQTNPRLVDMPQIPEEGHCVYVGELLTIS